MIKAIRIHARDNTATLFGDAQAGEPVSLVQENGEVALEVTVREFIPVGHKVALKEIGEGEQVFKYGEAIGVATQIIQKGEHVHIQNVVGAIFPGRPIPSNRKTG